MAADPFDGVLDLENDFFKEGYDLGVADGEHAGLVEGKIFGVEKGYEKALELGRMHGRALVWQARTQQSSDENPTSPAQQDEATEMSSLASAAPIATNSRLIKHIHGLLSTTDPATVQNDNSDQSVTEFDDRLARSHAKAKVIAAIVGETIKVESTSQVSTGIEEAKGLNARH